MTPAATWKEIGIEIGVSPERARQIYLAAMDKLRRQVLRDGYRAADFDFLVEREHEEECRDLRRHELLIKALHSPSLHGSRQPGKGREAVDLLARIDRPHKTTVEDSQYVTE